MQLIANNVKPTLGEITYSFEEEELTKAINFQSQQQD
jgi:ABC-2 type transport system ATP-binding protein